jgi:hypothetical protein
MTKLLFSQTVFVEEIQVNVGQDVQLSCIDQVVLPLLWLCVALGHGTNTVAEFEAGTLGWRILMEWLGLIF